MSQSCKGAALPGNRWENLDFARVALLARNSRSHRVSTLRTRTLYAIVKLDQIAATGGLSNGVAHRPLVPGATGPAADIEPTAFRTVSRDVVDADASRSSRRSEPNAGRDTSGGDVTGSERAGRCAPVSRAAGAGTSPGTFEADRSVGPSDAARDRAAGEGAAQPGTGSRNGERAAGRDASSPSRRSRDESRREAGADPLRSPGGGSNQACSPCSSPGQGAKGQGSGGGIRRGRDLAPERIAPGRRPPRGDGGCVRCRVLRPARQTDRPRRAGRRPRDRSLDRVGAAAPGRETGPSPSGPGAVIRLPVEGDVWATGPAPGRGHRVGNASETE